MWWKRCCEGGRRSQRWPRKPRGHEARFVERLARQSTLSPFARPLRAWVPAGSPDIKYLLLGVTLVWKFDENEDGAARFFGMLAALVVVGAGCFAAGWMISPVSDEEVLGRTIAVKWGDGKYGKAFYGAHVYVVPIEAGWSVRARIYMGRGGRFMDCDELGKVMSAADAVAHWGCLRFRDEGLYIGSGAANDILVKRSRFESGR